MPKLKPSAPKKAKKKRMEEEMKKFYHNKLHSGSKKGPIVTNPKQAIAIALSESGQSKKKKKHDDTKKVVTHLKKDIKTFDKEKKEDRELIKKLHHKRKHKK